MEKFFRENLTKCFSFLKNPVTSKENYQLVETKRKIYYFSNFSLDIDEFIGIYNMISTIKENVSKNMLNTIMVCIQGII